MRDPSDLLLACDFAEGLLRDHLDPESGLRVLVLRGSFSFCGYVGVRTDHVLAGLADFEFRCHHGITFSEWGQEGSWREPGWYWWGWDYGHCSDRRHFALPPGLPLQLQAELERLETTTARQRPLGLPQKDWTLGEVFEDCLKVRDSVKEELSRSSALAHLLVHRP